MSFSTPLEPSIWMAPSNRKMGYSHWWKKVNWCTLHNLVLFNGFSLHLHMLAFTNKNLKLWQPKQITSILFWLLFLTIRPLVDTFKKYLHADTDTYLQNVSIPIQIQHQKMYLCADTDTILQKFEAISWENVVSLTPLTLFIPWWCYNYYWLWCFTKNNSYDVKK